MLGVDLGLNVGSVTRVKKRKGKWVPTWHLVFKFTREKSIENEYDRILAIAERYFREIQHKAIPTGEIVYIEEPIFSWGRKNPKGFAKAVILLACIIFSMRASGISYKLVNNKSAKKIAGYGGKDKQAMIKAFKKMTGMEPGHSTQYGKETLADSFFIALAGHYAKNRC